MPPRPSFARASAVLLGVRVRSQTPGLIRFVLAIAAVAVLAASPLLGAADAVATAPAAWVERLADCNVTWTSPSLDEQGSMPTGNGDIGLNAWVEADGDLLFYIGKTDAWSDDAHSSAHTVGPKGLVKLGRTRLHLTPNPFVRGAPFRQVLSLHEAMIEIEAGAPESATTVRLWVDANRPVIHVETSSRTAHRVQASLELWRDGDRVIEGQADRVVWFHRDRSDAIPPLKNRTFGAVMRGDGLVSAGSGALRSTEARTQWAVSVYPLTAQTPSAAAWVAAVDELAERVDRTSLDAARAAHAAWWHEFWARSWIFVEGGEDADLVTRGYARQRFISAAAGRGEFPIRFNGSIFNVAYTTDQRVDGALRPITENADYRRWGTRYWMQNTRLIYWPMLAQGDFELMSPFFEMYKTILLANQRRVHAYYGHDGSYLAEVSSFWGELPEMPPAAPGYYVNHYYTPVLELSAMMLDYYAFTGDREFARSTLVPCADLGVTFFDRHFPRDERGRLLLAPANALETYWKAKNPAPDIAGLRVVLDGLLALPPELTDDAHREKWRRIRADLPDLPIAKTGDLELLLPAQEFDPPRNQENPELYAVFPFRLFGAGQPGLALAQATFEQRKFKGRTGWAQDPIQAACLGLTDSAATGVVSFFSDYAPQLRFPAFWHHDNDYAPNQCNGGNGQTTLQKMLLQSVGRRLLLLPAWPRKWSARFKFHAPENTVVEGVVTHGELTQLTVTPASRRRDVEIMRATAPGAK